MEDIDFDGKDQFLNFRPEEKRKRVLAPFWGGRKWRVTWAT